MDLIATASPDSPAPFQKRTNSKAEQEIEQTMGKALIKYTLKGEAKQFKNPLGTIGYTYLMSHFANHAPLPSFDIIAAAESNDAYFTEHKDQ